MALTLEQRRKRQLAKRENKHITGGFGGNASQRRKLKRVLKRENPQLWEDLYGKSKD